MFFYLCGLEPVAPRARFKCVWVFKDFSAEKPFGSQPRRHTSATELCHFRFLSRRRNQRKVQKRSKKHKTKADENGPDWIMSDLACAWLWGKSSFCLITLCLTAKWIKKKRQSTARLLEKQQPDRNCKYWLKVVWALHHSRSQNKKWEEGRNIQYDCTNFGNMDSFGLYIVGAIFSLLGTYCVPQTLITTWGPPLGSLCLESSDSMVTQYVHNSQVISKYQSVSLPDRICADASTCRVWSGIGTWYNIHFATS